LRRKYSDDLLPCGGRWQGAGQILPLNENDCKKFTLYFDYLYGCGIILATIETIMKQTIFRFFLIFSVTISSLNTAFAQADVITQVKETIKAGSAKELSKFLNQTIDVTIDDKVESYSKAQAEFVLRDFFKQHPPSEFSIIHQGSSKGGQPFAIGQYKSSSDTYRVFMKIKAVSSQQLVHEISFVKE
jgi:hypothetical protein